jgi:SAM-dependent methyltransferase
MTATTPAEDWTAVAPAWDASVDYVDSHSTSATAALLDAAAVRPGDRVLELASGPGSLGATLAELVGPDGHVVLSDVAPGMVEAARRRCAGLGNVDVAVLDASAIDRPDDDFDVVVCRMGLMFTPDPSATPAELSRVLHSGRSLAAHTWAGLEHHPRMTCVGMAAMLNGLVAGGPPIGPGGIFSLGDPTEVEALARGAELVDVRVDTVADTFRAESIDAHVDRVSSLAGPMAAAFAAATDEQRDAVRRTAAQLAADHTAPDGSLALPSLALLVTGRA